MQLTCTKCGKPLRTPDAVVDAEGFRVYVGTNPDVKAMACNVVPRAEHEFARTVNVWITLRCPVGHSSCVQVNMTAEGAELVMVLLADVPPELDPTKAE
jgi:hypothetical protein